MRDYQANYYGKEFRKPTKNRNKSGHKNNQFQFHSNKSEILIKDH